MLRLGFSLLCASSSMCWSRRKNVKSFTSKSFNSYAKAVLGNKSVDMSGKYGTSNAGAESVGALSPIVQRGYRDVGLHRYVSDSGTVGQRSPLGIRLSSSAHERCVWIDLVGLPLASWAPEVYKKLGGRWGSSVFTDMVSDGPMSHGKVCVLTESLHRVIESFIVSYRNRTYRIIATEFAYWAPNIESMEVNSESNPLERKDAEGPSLDESLENEEHLDVDSCDSDSPKNVNNDSVSPSSRVLREEDVRGVESDLVDSFEEGEIRDDSVLYNDGCIGLLGKVIGKLKLPVIAPEKDSIIVPPSTPPGNDLNIAAESGSSWNCIIMVL
ncbi:hypothetical protein Tco_0295768 [Tanacetum coccineum]